MDDLMNRIKSVLEDEESMKQLKELADMVAGGEFSGPSSPDGAGGESAGGAPFDIMKLMQVGSLFQKTASDPDAELLLALRPHLGGERQKKVDRAIKLLRLIALMTLLRENGVIGELDELL